MWTGIHTLPETNPLRNATARIRKFRRSYRSPLYQVADVLKVVPLESLETISPFVLEPWQGRVDTNVDETAAAQMETDCAVRIAVSSSGRNNKVGMGGVVRIPLSIPGGPRDETFNVTLGPRTEQNPYSAELAAVGHALMLLRNVRYHRIILATSNKAAVLSLKNPRQQSGQQYIYKAYAAMKAVRDAENTLSIVWIPTTAENELLKIAKGKAKEATRQNATLQAREAGMRSTTLRLAWGKRTWPKTLPDKVEATIASSAALAASINLIPLLLGGRTSRVADVIGVSRPTYYVAHYWIGRTAIIEGLVHAAIRLDEARQSQRFGPIAVSGCIALGNFLIILLLSLPWPRRMLGAAFHGVHRILYLAGMAGLVWHILLTQSLLHKVLVFVACGLWLLSHVYRVVARWRSAVVTEIWSDSEVTQVTRLRLRTLRPVAAFPGSYFYLYLPGSDLNYNLLRSCAVMMLWSDVEQTVTGTTTDFYILAGQQSRYLRRLMTIKTGDRMLLDGPYGQDLHLYRYETVILTAKGMGIVSVLPMALHLAARKAYDDSVRSQSKLDEDSTVGFTPPPAAATVFRDATRRIDLLWRLEHNDQDKWVAINSRLSRSWTQGG
ncbi:hypothetical protein C8A00DRAFT_36296 [Chaetomidium leptoderma]|uniref:FAD-binding FR-type domain-containing protein n=1 Tax=Chaetomidium leptoderma TaxID=669021 RepID=A0AAN6VGG8_9PEZI|nr:hypothetical protein C8A00DRAFT_36296 [Chaetomidium leptoderma]